MHRKISGIIVTLHVLLTGWLYDEKNSISMIILDMIWEILLSAALHRESVSAARKVQFP